jgi:AAA+ ATPase superfamily predicted ATPase
MIIGRVKEKKLLDNLIISNKPEFVTIYGRRRVGKTFLIRQYLKDKLLFDFTGSNEEGNQIQLNNFYREFKRQCSNNQPIPTNWSEAFSLLTDYLYTVKSTEKLIVFIDELPWLDRPKSGFLSALTYFWNQHGSQMPQLLLITCGSAASWIIKNLLDAQGGLYNRITQRIELKPFNLAETEAFLTAKNLKFTRYQIAQLYMMMGGIPFYLQGIQPQKSVNQVIDTLCFEEGGMLTNEFKPLYHSLFKNAENHISIIEELAKHPYGLSRLQLLAKTKIPNGGLFTRTIESLVDCGFIKKLQPFGNKNKEAIFRVIDFYSIFYLRFISGNITERSNTWQSIAESQSFKSWCGYAFENLCLNHLSQIHQTLGISGMQTQVSAWRFEGNDELPGAQIDLIIDRKDGIIHLCEAKFTNTEFVLTKDYNKILRQKRAVFQSQTKTKKAVVTSLISTFSAIKNAHYFEEIHSEICLDDLFENYN